MCMYPDRGPQKGQETPRMSEFVTAKCVGGPLDGREMTIRRGCTRFAQQLMDCDDPEDRANTAHYAMRVRVRPWSFEGESYCEYELVFQGIVIGATRAERDEANQQHDADIWRRSQNPCRCESCIHEYTPNEDATDGEPDIC